MFIIGNIQGGDALCGQRQFYGKTALRILRICDATPQCLSNIKVGSCKRLIMLDIMDLVNRNDTDALEALYQAPHWNAWFNVDFGGNPEGFITAACPPEALHALENGIFMHLLKVLFVEIL